MNKLPFNIDLNQVEILKQLNIANQYICELNGILRILPNHEIVLRLIYISELRDSSAIENIIMTYDDIFKVLVLKKTISGKTNEIINYKNAIENGKKLLKNKGFISTNFMVEIQGMIEPNKKGNRKIPGTFIGNDKTGRVIYTPSQDEKIIRELLHILKFLYMEMIYMIL